VRRALIFACALVAAPMMPAHAQVNTAIEGVEGVILDLAGQYMLGRLLNPSNDRLDTGPSNVWVGFQSQIECSDANNFESIVPGGVGLGCAPDRVYPPFGAGLQIQYNLTAADCATKAALGATAVRTTDVPSWQSVNPNTSVNFGPAGGFCRSSGAQLFTAVGTFLGRYIIAIRSFSDVQCAYMVNLCQPTPGAPDNGGCSCGLYSASFP